MKSILSLKLSAAVVAAVSTFAASSVLAVNPRIVSVSVTMYAGADLAHYTNGAENALLKAGLEFCEKFGEKLEKISNPVIQVQSELAAEGEKLKAVSLPYVNYSGLVTCTPK